MTDEETKEETEEVQPKPKSRSKRKNKQTNDAPKAWWEGLSPRRKSKFRSQK